MKLPPGIAILALPLMRRGFDVTERQSTCVNECSNFSSDLGVVTTQCSAADKTQCTASICSSAFSSAMNQCLTCLQSNPSATNAQTIIDSINTFQGELGSICSGGGSTTDTGGGDSTITTDSATNPPSDTGANTDSATDTGAASPPPATTNSATDTGGGDSAMSSTTDTGTASAATTNNAATDTPSATPVSTTVANTNSGTAGTGTTSQGGFVLPSIPNLGSGGGIVDTGGNSKSRSSSASASGASASATKKSSGLSTEVSLGLLVAGLAVCTLFQI